MSTLLTVNQAAADLQVSRSSLYELIGQGKIEVVRIGRSVRVPSDALTAFVETLRAEARGDADSEGHKVA